MKTLKHTDFAISAEATNENRSDSVLLGIYNPHDCKLVGGTYLTPSEAIDLGHALMDAAKLARKKKR